MPFVSSFFPGRISMSEKDFYIFFSPFSSCDRLENSLPLSVVKILKYSCSSLRIIFFTDFTIEAASHFQVFWVRSFRVFRSTRVINNTRLPLSLLSYHKIKLPMTKFFSGKNGWASLINTFSE